MSSARQSTALLHSLEVSKCKTRGSEPKSSVQTCAGKKKMGEVGSHLRGNIARLRKDCENGNNGSAEKWGAKERSRLRNHRDIAKQRTWEGLLIRQWAGRGVATACRPLLHNVFHTACCHSCLVLGGADRGNTLYSPASVLSGKSLECTQIEYRLIRLERSVQSVSDGHVPAGLYNAGSDILSRFPSGPALLPCVPSPAKTLAMYASTVA